jgi:hypothetical protein
MTASVAFDVCEITAVLTRGRRILVILAYALPRAATRAATCPGIGAIMPEIF